jgi:hypothetical protein
MNLPLAARSLIAAVALVAAAGTTAALATGGVERADWPTFIALAAGAAVTHSFLHRVRDHHGFSLAVLFLVAGALLLPPALVALLAVAQHLPDLLRRRYPALMQTFNAGNYALSALVAWASARAVAETGTSTGEAGWAAAALAAALAFVAVNHLVLAELLRLARGHSYRRSGLFSAESVSIDLVLALLGVAVAALSEANPVLVAVAIAPLVLVRRFLSLLASMHADTRVPAEAA